MERGTLDLAQVGRLPQRTCKPRILWYGTTGLESQNWICSGERT